MCIRDSIIGNQTITIETDELIIAQTVSKPYPAQYYDAPARYFTELKNYIDLNLKFVKVHDLNQTYMVVDSARKNNADIIAASALLSTTILQQKKLIEELKARGLRNKYKVMVGGAPVTREWAEEIGADGYGEDALEAVEVAKKLVGKA